MPDTHDPDLAISFGAFRLLPKSRLLEKDGAPAPPRRSRARHPHLSRPVREALGRLAARGFERELPFLGVDESFLPNGTTPNPTFTHDSGNFSGAFSHVNGADGATISYALAASGA